MNDIKTTAAEEAMRQIMEEKDKYVKKAIRDGYDGIDFLHPRPTLSLEGPPSVGFDPVPWNDPPPERFRNVRVDRIDFRPHDRADLLYLAEHGKWPE